MLQVSFIRENKEQVIEGLKKRNFNELSLIDQIIDLDNRRKETQTKLDDTLAQSNKLAKQIGELFKSGKAEEANTLKAQTGELKQKAQTLKDALQEIETELTNLLYHIPNIPHTLVPAGNSDQDNEMVFTENDIPQLPEGALSHWELAAKYNLIDFELGAKITGAGFPVYTGKGARLQRALIIFFLEEALKAGSTEIIPPFVLHEASGKGTD